MDSRNNKDPIERLFQQKAEEYDISYQEKDWLKLEKRLDERDQMIASRRLRWFIAAAVLLLFSLLCHLSELSGNRTASSATSGAGACPELPE